MDELTKVMWDKVKDRLKGRELQIYQLTRKGYSQYQIADMLGLSRSTVRTYADRIAKKAGR